jgi:multidrug resistance efflux pump
MRAAGQDPFAIFLAMGRGLLDDQRAEVAKADAAIAVAERQVEEAHALLAEAERELERARLAAAEARGKFAAIERAAGFAA